MIISLVDPNNTKFISDSDEVRACLKDLTPNDMLIWCKKDSSNEFAYVVGDYKQIRLTTYSFDDATLCAKALLGVITHYERVITRADKKFSQLEDHVQKMNKLFRELKNDKKKGEAKQRRDNPTPKSAGMVSNTDIDSALIEKIMTEIKAKPTIKEQVKLAEAEAKDKANAVPKHKEYVSFEDIMEAFFNSGK